MSNAGKYESVVGFKILLFISNFKNSLSSIMPQTFWMKLSGTWFRRLKLQIAVSPGHWAESHYQVHWSYKDLMHAVIYFYVRFPFSAISGNKSSNLIVKHNLCVYILMPGSDMFNIILCVSIVSSLSFLIPIRHSMDSLRYMFLLVFLKLCIVLNSNKYSTSSF